MFGYVTIRKPEMKIKDYDQYHSFYCGLCKELKDRYGRLGQVTLTYDMTFLVILLSSLYEEPVRKENQYCLLHPGKKQCIVRTKATKYGADMNMILSYAHLEDDWLDEKNAIAATGMALYKKKYQKLSEEYPLQCQCIKESLQQLHVLEEGNCQNVQEAAACFGQLMAEIMRYRKADIFTGDLEQIGYHLGKFIYIMDAYDDLEKDRKNGQYNPLNDLCQEKDWEEVIENMLYQEMVAVSTAFEKLPCLQYADILRNIIYAGVWNRFDYLKQEKAQKRNEKEEDRTDDESV